MIGIYKIQNKINGKIYIGQSNDIKRRFSEHKRSNNNRIIVDQAIKKYGAENFSYDIVEECSIDQLNEKETYWIKYYQSNIIGYNCNLGGNQQSIGESNGNSVLTEADIIFIRTSYQQHKRCKETYSLFENKISYGSFVNIWEGRSWAHIMPEVFTKENKEYYSKQATNGEKSHLAKFTNQEVLKLRERYIHESAKQIYEDYKERCGFQTLQQILWGRSYKDLPIYSKKEKKWIDK